MKRAHRFFPEMERTLKANGIPEDFKYLAVIESNLIQAVSPVERKVSAIHAVYSKRT